MAIKINCPHCNVAINAPDNLAGRTAKCPKCGGAVTVPAAQLLTRPHAILAEQTEPRPQVVIIQQPSPVSQPAAANESRTVIEHHHKAKGGAFRSGFGMALGCLIAIVVFTFGGCFIFGLIATEAAKNVATHIPSPPVAAASVVPEPETKRVPIAAPSIGPKLSSINVTSARIRKTEIGMIAIDLTVKNDSDDVLQKLMFHCIYKTPGRALPWVEADMNYEPKGGVEPGESQSWSLAPNMLSDFGRTDIHDGAVLTVTITDAKTIPSKKPSREKIAPPAATIEAPETTEPPHPKFDAAEALRKLKEKEAAEEEARFRTWSSANGQFTVEAKLNSIANGTAILETRAHAIKKVPVEKLSDADKDYMAKWKKERR